MLALMDWLLSEINGMPSAEYIVRREDVKGDWYLKDVDIPVEDDLPIKATWTSFEAEALRFYSAELVEDFANAHLIPRPCSILKRRYDNV